jgi:ABC-type oligopeptide transport system substrate-binding subunit
VDETYYDPHVRQIMSHKNSSFHFCPDSSKCLITDRKLCQVLPKMLLCYHLHTDLWTMFPPALKALLCTLLLLCALPALAGRGVDPASNSIQLALTTEPPNLNSLTATDSVSFFVLSHTQEGLLTYNEQGELTGGVAKDWHMDGTTVRFTLRDNARWCDGKPITAQDFVFAWRTALKASTASRYAFILYPIRNAQKVHEGNLPLDALGVYAEDKNICA